MPKKRKANAAAAAAAAAASSSPAAAQKEKAPDFFDFTLDDDDEEEEYVIRYRLNGKKKKLSHKTPAGASRKSRTTPSTSTTTSTTTGITAGPFYRVKPVTPAVELSTPNKKKKTMSSPSASCAASPNSRSWTTQEGKIWTMPRRRRRRRNRRGGRTESLSPQQNKGVKVEQQEEVTTSATCLTSSPTHFQKSAVEEKENDGTTAPGAPKKAAPLQSSGLTTRQPMTNNTANDNDSDDYSEVVVLAVVPGKAQDLEVDIDIDDSGADDPVEESPEDDGPEDNKDEEKDEEEEEEKDSDEDDDTNSARAAKKAKFDTQEKEISPTAGLSTSESTNSMSSKSGDDSSETKNDSNLDSDSDDADDTDDSDDDDESEDGGGKIGAVRDLQRVSSPSTGSLLTATHEQDGSESEVESEVEIDIDENHAEEIMPDVAASSTTNPVAVVDSDTSDDVVIISPLAATALIKREGTTRGLATATTSRNGASSAAARADNTMGEDDVEWVATANETRLPHMRQHCTDYVFDPNHELTLNKRFCDMCYCYVCDVPAKECQAWASSPHRLGNHCHAHDSNRYSQYWKSRRTSIAQEKGNAGATTPIATEVNPLMGNGPFSPENAAAQSNPTLTKCRKCGWYNRFLHQNFRQPQNLHPVGFLDWCHKCGRVANDKDFGKVQSVPLVPQEGDIFLGTKELTFSIVSHDPREMEKYQDSWLEADTNAPEWLYDEGEMAEDLFLHRFGNRPTLSMILASVAIVKKSEMPRTGSFCLSTHSQANSIRYLVGGLTFQRAFYWKTNVTSEDRRLPSVDETEGIILGKPGDLILLQQIAYFEEAGFCKRKPATKATAGVMSTLSYELTAKWDKKTQSGTFAVKLYIRPPKGRFKTKGAASFNKLLGAWYDVFPLALSEISGSLTAKEPSKDDRGSGYYFARSDRSIPVPPFTASPEEVQSEMKKNRKEIGSSVKDLNERAASFRQGLCLESTHESKMLGGVSPVEAGFSNTLQRYFGEMLVEDVVKGSENGGKWFNNCRGIVSSHRSMRAGGAGLPGTKISQNRFVDSSVLHDLCYVRSEDRPLAFSLRESCNSIFHGTASIAGMIAHCENLNHNEVAYVEGLNVELLQFQRQSVHWALARETQEGGLQSWLWPKLPQTAYPRKKPVYYNPIIETFRTKKPHLCRGGIVAEEMGLGKTIISLALILLNPAPLLPTSGSSVAKLDSVDDGESKWDKDLNARCSADKPGRGSILSRGTLVVCPVSLVGQWIEEAKSKLSDPGMVYAYHGANRKRNSKILAQNAIVVTTYETVASDATYHATKDGSANYVAPLEKIRWWRIICDESHCLRDATVQKSKAVAALVGDHKWVVSGTPVQTSLMDLKNQLKFLGLERVDEMFQTFGNVLQHTNDRKAKQSSRKRRFRYNIGDSTGPILGHFLFLLRTVLIRHSQQQCYRGSSPRVTLMSLPPKTERSVFVEMTENERHEYDLLEEKALSFYSNFRAKNRKNLSKFFVKLNSKLTPMRIACAGGPFPLEDTGTNGDDMHDDEMDNEKGKRNDEEEHDDDDDGEDDGDGEKDDNDKPKKKKTKKVKFSDFVFKSKVKKLIQELEHARDTDPSAKSLVFSQFTSSLQYLQDELPKHGFQYRTLSGDMSMRKRAKALHDFQHDPPTTIFLLSMRAGAVGINLTQANRVFLLEPCFNPALLKQSIGRVHRLGQKRSVEVVHLIMTDSVESRMQEMLEQKYGSGSDDEDRDDEDDGDKEDDEDSHANNRVASVPPTTNTLVGSVNRDKATILAAEFDLLFGFTEPEGEATKQENVADNSLLPDAVMSSFGQGGDEDGHENGIV